MTDWSLLQEPRAHYLATGGLSPDDERLMRRMAEEIADLLKRRGADYSEISVRKAEELWSRGRDSHIYTAVLDMRRFRPAIADDAEKLYYAVIFDGSSWRVDVRQARPLDNRVAKGAWLGSFAQALGALTE